MFVAWNIKGLPKGLFQAFHKVIAYFIHSKPNINGGFTIQQNTNIAQSKETTTETIGLLINGKKCFFKLAILHKRLKERFQTFFRNWC